VMKEIGIGLAKQKPKLLTQGMIQKVDKLITMGRLHLESVEFFIFQIAS